MDVVGIIPARFQSTRFPGKPLAKICGRPMIEWVYKRAKMCKRFSRLIVATDDERIFGAVKAFGGNCTITPSNLTSGTDRVAFVARDLKCDVVVNIQGDEPLIEPYTLERLIELFERDKDIKMATLASPILNEEEMRNPNVVKVVMDKDNFSLYFSRSPIPYLREVKFKDSTCFKHIGIYGFKKDFLLDFASTPRGILEESESLEQLRALENGIRIKVGLIEKWNGVSVDNPEDIAKVENEIKKGGITPP